MSFRSCVSALDFSQPPGSVDAVRANADLDEHRTMIADRPNADQASACSVILHHARLAALAGLVFGALMLAATQLTAQSATSDRTLVVLGFGGSYGQAIKDVVIAPFERQTGIKTIYNETCCASVGSAMEADQFLADVVIGIDYGGLLSWANRNYLRSDERFATLAKECGMPSQFVRPVGLVTQEYAYVIAGHGRDQHLPISWAQFWDAKTFPGPRSLNRISPSGQMEAALLADGVAPDSLYPLDIDRAFASLDRLRKSTKVMFAQSGADQVNMLATGAVEYAIGYSNRIYAGIRDGLPISYTLDQGLHTEVAAGLFRTARNVDGALAFLAYQMRPEVLSAIAERTGLRPLCPQMLKPPEAGVASPATGGKEFRLNFEYWGQNRESVGNRWVEWIVK
jgi:putative spermidine/putrescine transport system substrate-binding protein